MSQKFRIETRLTNSGFTIAVTDQERTRLVPIANTPQSRPRRYYVYAHTKEDGAIFYIGKGTDRRAWSEDRHSTWHRYVEKHLHGQYKVLILQDDLSDAEAEELESEWIAQEGETLVNWINFGRQLDFERNRQLHALRDANRELIERAKAAEAGDLAAAASMYVQAIAATAAYEVWDDEGGLVGQLLREEREEQGLHGERAAIDRLTMCLIKLGRVAEAQSHFKAYFERYVADRQFPTFAAIAKRLDKAEARLKRKQSRT